MSLWLSYSVLSVPSVRSAAAVTFTDVTTQAGIRFVHNSGAFGRKYLPETMGAGAVLSEEGLPQLRISPVYRRLLDKAAVENTDETRAYVKDKFRSALWLIKSVEQRQKTIHKVATSIINFQRDFLDHGIEYLRPLVLRDVANDIGMHESTVSRVVTNKYMHTPQGVFEMKYFFHSGISSSYGESVSSVTIKQRIRKIIENEDPRKPLSDSKIVSILQREGLVLARRTIAKYREELKIPTSNQRKVLY